MEKLVGYVPNQGEYVEGIEEFTCYSGDKQTRVMRGWVDHIFGDKVYIQADDSYCGNRGTSIRLNSTRRVFVRAPEWWKTVDRKIEPGTIVKHFKNKLYEVLFYAKDVSDGIDHDVVVYRALYGNKDIYCRDAIEFNSVIDREKYPEAQQVYRFEIVNR